MTRTYISVTAGGGMLGAIIRAIREHVIRHPYSLIGCQEAETLA